MRTEQLDISFKSIKRETLAKQVVHQIMDLIHSGQLKPGDKLPTEAELTDKLLVSRPVLREALSSLETMGIIHRKAREGTYFSEKIGSKPYSIMLALSSGDIPSIIESRMALELGLVTIAAEKITSEQLEKLEENLYLISLNNEDYVDIDKDFHRIIAHSANNSVLEGMVDPLLNMYDATLKRIPLLERNHVLTLQQHQAIFQALKKRDAIEAYSSMYAHLSYVRERLMKGLNQG